MSVIQTINVESKALPIETVGHTSGEKISVQISTRFLEHFSKQLYSSPQKAFEELISNGWDAGADSVDVRISDDLRHADATMCVLDDGSSMDAEGLRQLWHIAFSTKTHAPVHNGRHVIGKFGIGKLATYVLANKLTYICKASDGVIRRVTMDYSTVDHAEGTVTDQLINKQELEIFELDEDELAEALSGVDSGSVILELIKAGVPKSEEMMGEDEFEWQKEELQRPADSNTWTLAVLSGLKPTGREMKVGILRRMLEAALPFGSEMAICLNGELLKSSKIDRPTFLDLKICSALGINSVELKVENDGSLTELEAVDEGELSSTALESGKLIKIPVTATDTHVEIKGIGRITGRVRLFKDIISSGKSAERGSSNGFHVNVLGRVVNQDDPSFGEKNLSHAAWARFRMAVRADGLNSFLTINREQFQENRELKIFRSFLRKVFNKFRVQYDSDKNVSLPDGGDVLVRSLGVLRWSQIVLHECSLTLIPFSFPLSNFLANFSSRSAAHFFS